MKTNKMVFIKKILIGLLLIIISILVGLLKPVIGAENSNPQYYIGLFANYNYNYHFADFKDLQGFITCCPKFENGSGSGFTFGGLFEMPINNQWYFGARLGYATIGADLINEEAIANVDLRELDPPFKPIKLDKAVVEYSLISDISIIAIDPYIAYNIYEGLDASAGFRVAYVMNSKIESMKEQLMSPDYLTFMDGSRLRNVYTNEEIPEPNKLQMFLQLGLNYNLPVGKNKFLSPEIRYFYPLTKINKEDWKASTLSIGASFKYPMYKSEDLEEETIIIRDTTTVKKFGINETTVVLERSTKTKQIVDGKENKIERTTIREEYLRTEPKTSIIKADFSVYGVTNDGRRQENPQVVIEEVETEEMFPLLPYVFFSEADSRLDKTSMKLLNPELVTNFKEDDLAWNTLQIYDNLLNIVAQRLKSRPKAELLITGCNSNENKELNNMALSETRAEAVKSYFVSVWGIDAKRIKVAKQNLPAKPSNPSSIDGVAENRRVELSSNDNEILKPLTLKEIIKSSNPPIVELIPNIVTEAGLKNYKFNISQSGKNLRLIDGGDDIKKQIWQIEQEPMPQLETAVDINLSAEDNYGQKADAEKEIKISQKTIKIKRERIEEDYKVDRYSLIVFDFDKAEVNEAHKRILNEIKKKIMPNSKVIISGFADRTGSSEYNKDLARRRSEEVQKVLQISAQNLTINPVGSDRLLYDNNIPEGRSYCRTVKIEIKTPIK